MDDLKDQSAVSTTATNGVVESEEVRAQEALLGDTDPSLTSADDVAKALNVDPSHGLSEEEAKRRLAKFGPNELASAPPVPKWKKFLAQFQDPLVYLLIAATIISVIAWFIEKANAQPGAEGGEVLPFDAIVIILILIVNAVLGYMQEAKAEAAVEALAQMTAPQTSVLRDDKVMRINTADVVPGDIIVLAEGDSVSADGRLVNAASLRIAEASLTGESVPVGKKPDTLTEAKALGDRANMIFNGTSVTQGTGRAIVTGTGMNTQVGKIADMLSATEDEKTPLQKEMDYVSKILGIAVCVIAVVVLVALAVLEGFNDVHDVIDSLLLAVSLAVAAVPEGLAAILTVVLALGVQRMAAHNAIVKKLHSVETLGSASVICSDKTGTLTEGHPTVIAWLWAQCQEEYFKEVLLAAEMNSTNSLATAISTALREEGIIPARLDVCEVLKGKGMRVVYKDAEYWVGSHKLLKDYHVYLSDVLGDMLVEYESEGNSIVYFGRKNELLAIIAVKDQLKAAALGTVRELRASELDICMLTGDGERTASTIAGKLGIIRYMPDALPDDKETFIRELQLQGKMVVMIGDGINDVQALTCADVSIAMGENPDDATVEKTMVVMKSSDLQSLPKLFGLSRHTLRLMHQNSFWMVIYHLIGVLIAAGILYPVYGILLTPMLAAIVILLSCVTLIRS